MLTDKGKRYPSLSAFYNHIKFLEIEAYLKDKFNYDNLSTILDKLQIKDKDINYSLKIINTVEKEVNKIKKQLIKNGYR